MEQGLCQGCMLASRLLGIFFAAVINKYSLHAFQGAQRHHGRLVHLRKKTGREGRGGATAGDPALATSLWGMLYPDDAGVVS